MSKGTREVAGGISAWFKTAAEVHARWFMAEWRWLLVSLLLATILFFAVRANISFTADFNIPVQVELADGGSTAENGSAGIAVSHDTSMVTVTLRGTERTLDNLHNRQNMGLRIDIGSHAKVNGDIDVNIAPHFAGIFGNRLGVKCTYDGIGSARIVDVEPKHIRVTMNKRVELPFEIDGTPATQGTPAIGKATVTFSPKKVTLAGSESQLKPLFDSGVKLKTEPIDLEGRAKSFTRTVKVQPPADAPWAAISPYVVTAHVAIAEQLDLMSISNVPVRVTQETGGIGMTWMAEPSNVVIRLRGTADALAAVPTRGLWVVVDADSGDDFDKSTVLIPYRDFDGGVEFLSVDPPYVKLVRIADGAQGAGPEQSGGVGAQPEPPGNDAARAEPRPDNPPQEGQ